MKYFVRIYKTDKKGIETLEKTRNFEDKKEAEAAMKEWNTKGKEKDEEGNCYHAEMRRF